MICLETRLAELVQSQETYDEKLAKGQCVVVDAVACTTMGLSRFLKDTLQEDMNGRHYFETIPVARIRSGRWPFRREKTVHNQESLELLKLNRIFGRTAGWKDTIWTENPGLASISEEYGDMLGIFALDPTTLLEPYQGSDPRTLKSIQTLKNTFGAEGSTRLAQLASARCGVQLIYGGEGFHEQVMAGAVRDYNHETAYTSEHRVPPEFIRAILPLGKYEQDQLGLA